MKEQKNLSVNALTNQNVGLCQHNNVIQSSFDTEN